MGKESSLEGVYWGGWVVENGVVARGSSGDGKLWVGGGVGKG